MTDLGTTGQPLYDDALLERLRTALIEHFSPGERPDAVDFRITEEHDEIEGLAWAGDGALLVFGPHTVAAGDLTGAVGDELDDVSDFHAPRFGDTLVIALSPDFVPEQKNDDGEPPAFDPQDPQPALTAYDDKILDGIERALNTVRIQRTQTALTHAVVAALPAIAEEEPLASNAPVARVVFRTLWDENGTHFSELASAHHADGAVTPDLDFEGFADEQLDHLTELLRPMDGEQLIASLPGVTMLVEPCTVCDDTNCRNKGGSAFATCAVCPEAYSVEHCAHPRSDCSGFALLPASTPLST
ncbi:hypothetical protein [Streptomyces sp. NPDC051662]|uniref:hypothetical protein n=1 Tax=Streptomyces sp. NPDC051662 TaxID=3154750 RepID=UPI00342A8D66